MRQRCLPPPLLSLPIGEEGQKKKEIPPFFHPLGRTGKETAEKKRRGEKAPEKCISSLLSSPLFRSLLRWLQTRKEGGGAPPFPPKGPSFWTQEELNGSSSFFLPPQKTPERKKEKGGKRKGKKGDQIAPSGLGQFSPSPSGYCLLKTKNHLMSTFRLMV